ncbi:MAG: hypothetical protein KAG61_01420 [Bacteriovoracaceae bacterium]|nr:hypothetical protein [Bacteriovoracaceae bacterium]
MKTLIALILLSVTTLSFAEGSLECTFTKNFENISMVEVLAEIDEEESSENYFGKVGSVQAEVLYLPYQEGIYLSITDTSRGVEASAVNHNNAEVTLTIGKDTYALFCEEIW